MTIKIINVYSLSKRDILNKAIDLVDDFSRVNRIMPYRLKESRYPYARNIFQVKGMFVSPNVIYVNLDKCAIPGSGTRMRFSFPGYKVDATPFGVLCHEFGHYISWLKNGIGRSYEWELIVNNSRRISGYEPNSEESFAESFRLFLTNSDMLKRGSGARYEFMLKLGLKPVVKDNFIKVLKERGVCRNILKCAKNYCDI